MLVTLYDQWGAKNSEPAWHALRQGLDRAGLRYTSHDAQADIAVIWSVVWNGRMAQNRQIYEQYRHSGRPVIVMEVGALHRGKTWKLGLNGTGLANFPAGPQQNDRARLLSLQLHPWKTSGRNIVIACQRDDSEQWQGLAPRDLWLAKTVDQLKSVTDRPIVIRPHPRQRITVPEGCVIDNPRKLSGTYDDFDLSRILSQAWCVVNWNSGVGPIAAMTGVPVLVGESSLAAPVGTLDWLTVEQPAMPDRDQWLVDLAHTEWTLEEIASGYPVRRLLGLA